MRRVRMEHARVVNPPSRAPSSIARNSSAASPMPRPLLICAADAETAVGTAPVRMSMIWQFAPASSGWSSSSTSQCARSRSRPAGVGSSARNSRPARATGPPFPTGGIGTDARGFRECFQTTARRPLRLVQHALPPQRHAWRGIGPDRLVAPRAMARNRVSVAARACARPVVNACCQSQRIQLPGFLRSS